MRARRAAAVAIALLVGTACGGGDDPSDERVPEPSTTVDAYDSGAGLDPAIQERYGAGVEALGMRITRAARYEQLGSQTVAPSGRHLAIYVEPVADSTTEAFIGRIKPLADVFLPEVFDEMPELDSMDVCQEPPPGVDDAPEPKAYTQLVVTRSQAAAIDWPSMTVLDLVGAAVDHPNRIGLGVGEPVKETAEWQRLHADALSVTGESN